MRIRRGDILSDMDEVPIHLHIEPQDEGGFLATSPDVPGLIVEADSVSDAITTAKGLAAKIAESCIANGFPVPPALRKRVKPVAIDVVIAVEAF
jgi:antitoxin HicB